MIDICLLTEKKSISLTPIIRNVNFLTQYCLGNVSEKFDDVDLRKVTFKGSVHYFSDH